MKLSEFKISVSVESYHEKIAEIYQNYYVAEKHIVSKLSKIELVGMYIFQSREYALCNRFCGLVSES